MFYSHESTYLQESLEIMLTAIQVLTSRKHGVATVWYVIYHTHYHSHASRLVATLGSKSTLKKVSRKAILDVNVPKACETITDADTPMALRLQGSLLYVLVICLLGIPLTP